MNYPDFILIPYQLIADKNIEPIAEKLYGVIYWYAKMKLEKCFVSNVVLAEFLNTTPRTIQNSLDSLEKAGYIQRLFKDKSRRHRSEIIPLITFGGIVNKQSEAKVTPKKQSEMAVTQTETAVTLERNGGDHNKNINNNTKKEVKSSAEAHAQKEETKPKDFADKFFKDVYTLVNLPKGTKPPPELEWLIQMLHELHERNNVPKAALWSEIKDFCAYWNEQNHMGTKRKWQMQKTFEIGRRLTTWFSRAKFKGFTASVDFNNKPKGSTVII